MEELQKQLEAANGGDLVDVQATSTGRGMYVSSVADLEGGPWGQSSYVFLYRMFIRSLFAKIVFKNGLL